MNIMPIDITIISGKISIIGLTARPEVAMSTITAPTATTSTMTPEMISPVPFGFCCTGIGA